MTADQDTAEIVRWMRGRELLEENNLTKNVFRKTADTIDRLQKERDELNTENLRVIDRNLFLVAEVERLKASLATAQFPEDHQDEFGL